MNTNGLLKHDLAAMMTCRPGPEAEVLAGRIVDLIYDAAKETAEDSLIEHCNMSEHKHKEPY